MATLIICSVCKFRHEENKLINEQNCNFCKFWKRCETLTNKGYCKLKIRQTRYYTNSDFGCNKFINK